MNMRALLPKLTVAIPLLVSLSSQVVAAPVRFDFLPEGQRAFPVSVIFEGELFQPPRAIERATAKADHSSPEAVMAAMLKAGYDGDANAYNSLYVAGEQGSSLAAGSKGESVKAEASAKLYFGDFVILVCEFKSSDGIDQHPFVFRKQGGKFFLTDALSNTNTAYQLFEGSFLFGPKPVFVPNKPSGSSNVVSEVVVAPNRPQLPRSVTVQFEGQFFNPGLRFTNTVVRGKQNLTTPEAALAAIYSAAKAADFDWYLSLVAPEERESASDLNVPLRKMLQDELPQLGSKLALQPPPNLIKVVRYGDYAILLLRDAATPPEKIDWLVLKRNGTDWQLSDKLRSGDPVLGYFLGKTEMFSYGYQKVLPAL